MRLIDLAELTETTGRVAGPTAEIEITGLTADSRKVAPGYLFAALPGSTRDGRAFIDDAVARGAAAVLAPPRTALGSYDRPVALLADSNPRRSLARMAAKFYGRQPDFVAAVTGTNGKTSVAAFTRQIWQRCGRSAASLGTLGAEPPHALAPGALTTPDPVDLQHYLAVLHDEGCDHLALEASSHGLDQSRLDGVRIEAAAFTNLTRDHLDYHGSMEAYLAAKQRLFRELLAPCGTAVLNVSLPCFNALQAACRGRDLRVLSFGKIDSDLQVVRQQSTAEGQDLDLRIFGRPYSVSVPLAGAFQACNVLAALGLALASGVDETEALAALAELHGAPGRLELVARTPAGGRVFVDYAHTPDALATVLAALRPHTQGRLVVAFGAGGDRDRGKRPQMGDVAGRLADRVIVTDDNPRSEDPAAIRRQILAAVPGATEIGDRGTAIATAMADLGPGDTLIIAGKGHETGQIVGGTVLAFNDREFARATVRELGGEAT